MSLFCACFSTPKEELLDGDVDHCNGDENSPSKMVKEASIQSVIPVEFAQRTVEAPQKDLQIENLVSESVSQEQKHSIDESAKLNEQIGALMKFRNSGIPELSQVIQDFSDSGVHSLLNGQELDEAMSAELANLIGRLESVTSRLENIAARTGGQAAVGDDVPATVVAFDVIIDGPLKVFLDHSRSIGGDVVKQVEMVAEAFQAERSFLLIAAKSKQPEQDQLMKLLAPTSEQIQAIQNFRESNRKSPFFNHLSALSESIPALGWVAVSPAPAPFVKEMNDAGQFYTNRVLKDWKEKDKVHVEWVKTWIQVLNDLQAYVKQHHTTGLTWNPKGQTATSVPAAPKAKSPAGAPPAPCPPPPPPMGGLDMSAPREENADDARNQLFAALNKGEDVTKGLKKVTADMQTHKNPTLRSGPAPFKSGGAPAIAPKPTIAKAVEKPPKFELDGKKWIIEYQKNQQGLTVSETEMNQVVYIFKCEACTVQVKGKVNSIVVDSCKKTAIVFDSVVSSVEFVNSQSAQMQVLGTVPTISIDKTDGCQLYLSKDSLEVVIVSAKSSEMNVLVPKEDGDYVEYAMPEQYKTTFNGKGLTTVISEIA